MIILGISAFYHDSAACILDNGKVIVAVEEERFSRIKHDNGFPSLAIGYCLDFANLTLEKVDRVVFYEKPFVHFERILETVIDSAPSSLPQFLHSMPIWLKDKLNMRRLIKKELKKFGKGYDKVQICFSEHHLSHAALAYYTSPFEDSAVLVIDAVGEWATTSLMKANGDIITPLKEQHFPHSIGLLYSSVTYYLGFKVNSDEYKVMGLAPYGDPSSEQTKAFIDVIQNQLMHINPDGSIQLNMKYFSFTKNLRLINKCRWEKLLGISIREPYSEIKQCHCNLAFAIQFVLESIAARLVDTLKTLSQSNNLCISGGTALNCAMNGNIIESKVYDNLFVPFSPGDGGGAIGAALAYYYSNGGKRKANNSSPYLGPAFSDTETEKVLKENQLPYSFIDDEDKLLEKVASFLKDGKIIGWFQGRMEFGPRALGNRSILASAEQADMKDKINASIKFREGFRPFAPVVIDELKSQLYKMDFQSPYMMITTHVKDGIRKPRPSGSSPFEERVSADLSSIPAVTHFDYSSRVQTVTAESNPLLHRLLYTYYNKTGCPTLLNTSFNVMGEPIVCSPQDAINTFLKSGINYLVIGHYIIDKNELR